LREGGKGKKRKEVDFSLFGGRERRRGIASGVSGGPKRRRGPSSK